MRRMGDSSSPLGTYPGVDAWAFYIGGDTPHVWSDEEIAAIPCRWLLPIYTRSNPAGHDGASEGRSVAAWLRAHHVPAGCAVALDYEIAVNAVYVAAFSAAVTAAGWTVLLYGSLSSVTQNPRPSAGYWTASWTGVPHLDPGAAATQYISDIQLGRPYDLSEVSDGLALWDTRPPAPTVAHASTEDEMPAFQNGEIKPGWFTDANGKETQENLTVVVVPPSQSGAIGWGPAWLSLGCDFGPVRLRVGLKVDGRQGWQVSEHTIASTDDRLSIPLPAGTGKISIGRMAQSASDNPAWPCGWMVEQS